MSKRFESINKDFFSCIEDNRSGLLYCTTNHNDMKDLVNLLNTQAERIAELEEQLKKSLESNNDLLKQIMDLQSQLIVERLKGE